MAGRTRLYGINLFGEKLEFSGFTGGLAEYWDVFSSHDSGILFHPSPYVLSFTGADVWSALDYDVDTNEMYIYRTIISKSRGVYHSRANNSLRYLQWYLRVACYFAAVRAGADRCQGGRFCQVAIAVSGWQG